MKVVSWNLLRLSGAAVEDVAALIERERPDLLLLQEATREVASLPAFAGGQVYHDLLPERIHGLAAWSPHPLTPAESVVLPVSQMPGRLAPRIAQIVELEGISFANVHLSHGQLLNRRQLNCVAQSLEGPAAIIGDYNAVGPTVLPEFLDVGPRRITHVASNVIPFRLDRCLVRDLVCVGARTLDRGPSDHRPIILDLRAADDAVEPSVATLAAGRHMRSIRSFQQTLLRRDRPLVGTADGKPAKRSRQGAIADRLAWRVRRRRAGGADLEQRASAGDP